jgi:hypothetical protein
MITYFTNRTSVHFRTRGVRKWAVSFAPMKSLQTANSNFAQSSKWASFDETSASAETYQEVRAV